MTKIIAGLLFLWMLIIGSMPIAHAKFYGRRLCSTPGYTCIKIRRGETWQNLWPDPQARRIVMRINRRNLALYPGLVIAVPNNLDEITHMDVAPLPYFIKPPGSQNVIILDIKKQAFGAYNRNGYLVHWGPISVGRDWCPDISRSCNTPKGTFFIFTKGDRDCESKVYPIPEGGAPMSFCMYFYKGFAMHSGDLPGRNASHGCVRMFYEDAEWLNQNFITMGRGGTKVIVR